MKKFMYFAVATYFIASTIIGCFAAFNYKNFLNKLYKTFED